MVTANSCFTKRLLITISTEFIITYKCRFPRYAFYGKAPVRSVIIHTSGIFSIALWYYLSLQVLYPLQRLEPQSPPRAGFFISPIFPFLPCPVAIKLRAVFHFALQVSDQGNSARRVNFTAIFIAGFSTISPCITNSLGKPSPSIFAEQFR